MILKIPSLHPNLKAEDTNFPVHFELHENKRLTLTYFCVPRGTFRQIF